ncbi:unnamed protein product [Prorocentrum cordatum]|uniref:Uncharacterized protein n=1 Tax=Prorocentrum cordatum TaxID=2364126 RepID=A0ABN9R410_9DINO|nr:unnamed protein product [Polarella glacialis]
MSGEDEEGDGTGEFSGAVLTDGAQQASSASGAAGGLSTEQLRELIAGVVRETTSATSSAAASSSGEKKNDTGDPWQQAASGAEGASAAARREGTRDGGGAERSKDRSDKDESAWDRWKKDDNGWWSKDDDGRKKDDDDWKSKDDKGDGWRDSDWRAARWSHDSWGGFGGKGDYSDPPAWPGWNHYRQWRRALKRWDTNTDVPAWRRAEKLLKLFDYNLQAKFDDVPESTLTGLGWLEVILGRMDMMTGEREGDDLRRAGRKALFEAQRNKDEALIQFVSRREAQLTEAESHEMWLSPKLKGLLLEEGAGLTSQGQQNLRTLTQGRMDYSSVSWALRQMDATGSERLLPGRQGLGAMPATGAEEQDPSEVEARQAFPSASFPPSGRSVVVVVVSPPSSSLSQPPPPHRPAFAAAAAVCSNRPTISPD